MEELKKICKDVKVIPSKTENLNSPWCNGFGYMHNSTNLCLHKEILDFTEWVSPSEEEKYLRLLIIKRFKSSLELLWPSAKLLVHGSTVTNSYVPGSDLDFVVVDSPQNLNIEDQLNILHNHLLNLKQIVQSKIIYAAKCPIIKAIDFPFGFSLDIAIGNENGILNVPRQLSLFKSFPEIYPLLMVLKVFLINNNLDQPYRGGINSNTLIQLIFFIIQKEFPKKNLGEYLLSFFTTFGQNFNYITTGISTRNGGRLFSRIDFDKISWNCPINFCIEDPQIPGSFLGENAFDTLKLYNTCFRMKKIIIGNKNENNTLLYELIRSVKWIVDKKFEIKQKYQELFCQSVSKFQIQLKNKINKENEPLRYN